MHEECLICGAPLVYLTQDEEMECALCHRRERSKTRCQKGHYVCNTCHTRGLDQLVALCRREESRNPWTILEHLMAQPFCHMHGPEHHTMVGAALLTAYHNAGGALDLEQALPEMLRRGSQVPGGACGFWGACGAGISAGMYVSIATGATPLAGEPWGLANRMTSQALARIGAVGGPRCCKRNAHLAIQAAVDFTRANLGVDLEGDAAPCTHFPENNQCLRDRCPFYPREGRRPKVALLCVHNACRSQMAEALGRKYLAPYCDCYSAGTEVKDRINPDAVRLMKQVHGIDMEKDQYPKLLSALPPVDLVVTMGCDVACPATPATARQDWGLEDPTGQGDEVFLQVMDQIQTKVLALKETVLALGTTAP